MSLKVIQEIEKIIELKHEEYTTLVAEDIFSKAVATILSQNTNDKNSIKAFENLRKILNITPENILNTSDDTIISAIKVSGLYQQKLKTIKLLAKRTLEEFNGDLHKLSEVGLEDARKWLLSIHGIGKKTADIILLHLGYPTFPVDTHISRITCRLGFTDSRDYDSVSNYWRKTLPPNLYLKGHLLLIGFGRKICVSRKPKCGICILNDICKYYKEDGKSC